MIVKDLDDNTSTDEMGEYLHRLIMSKQDPGYAADRFITTDSTDLRRVTAVEEPARDFPNTTPGIPFPAVSMVLELGSEQRFRVTVEEIW